MDREILIYIGLGILIAVIIASFLVTSGIIKFGLGTPVSSGSYDFSKMPQECKPPQGQDVQQWKEHLGHHENTKYCLEYYN